MQIIFLNIDDSERVRERDACVCVYTVEIYALKRSFGWIEFRKVLMESKWFTQESPISTWHPPEKNAAKAARRKKETNQAIDVYRSFTLHN